MLQRLIVHLIEVALLKARAHRISPADGMLVPSSVTRRLEYFSILGHLNEQTFAQDFGKVVN